MSPETSRENCVKFEPFLEDYVNGELSRAEAERISAHLASCSNCRAALEDARLAAQLVSAAFVPVADPGPGFVRMVMARIDVAERWMKEQRSFWRPFEALAWRLAFSAALVLAFLFAYGIRLSHQQQTAGPAVVSTQQQDIFTVPASTGPVNNDQVLLAIADHHYEP